jgi:RNA polymerase sigma-70 factor (ECF subfamily)
VTNGKNKQYMAVAWGEYRQKLHSFILTKVNSSEDAEDILADVFLKLAQQTQLSRVPQKLPNWLYRVTAHAIIDYYRTKKPADELPRDLMEDRIEPQAISTLSVCIRPMIDELPNTYKLPLLLSEIDGKSQKQVAEELGLSLSAVKSRILRGRKKLKDLMAKRCTLHHNKSGQLVDYEEKGFSIKR